MRLFVALTIALLGLSFSIRPVQAISLGMPIDCTVGVDCSLQNFVDVRRDDRVEDFRCGGFTYDQHKGTDFRLPHRRAMDEGVPVLTMAPGQVVGMRDGEAEGYISDRGGPGVLGGKDCGNGVRIDHGAGWVSQYCHMRKGSVRVRPGQSVAKGDVLGLVGMSGRTDFPHLHISLSHNDRIVDPFMGKEPVSGCDRGELTPLWDAGIAEGLIYATPSYSVAGFLDRKPEKRELDGPPALLTEISSRSPFLIFYGRAFNLQKGDRVSLQMIDEAGQEIAGHLTDPFDNDKAQVERWIGIRRQGDALKSGVYVGQFRVLRGERAVAREDVAVTVR